MKPAPVLLLLLFPTVILAAPVPKESPDAAMKRAFGVVVDPESEITCEASGKGGLKVTVPKGMAAREVGHFGAVQPLVVKEVEGDFVVTVRLRHEFDSEAGAADGQKAPSLAAGIAVMGSDPKCGVWLADTCSKAVGKEEWTDGMYMQSVSRNGGSGSSRGGVKQDGKPKYLRLTRKGDDFKGENSTDGKKWQVFSSHKPQGMSESVRVGPMAFHSTAGAYTVEFDEYELKPLKEEVKK